jgi:hypothetical protein
MVGCRQVPPSSGQEWVTVTNCTSGNCHISPFVASGGPSYVGDDVCVYMQGTNLCCYFVGHHLFPCSCFWLRNSMPVASAKLGGMILSREVTWFACIALWISRFFLFLYLYRAILLGILVMQVFYNDLQLICISKQHKLVWIVNSSMVWVRVLRANMR